MEWKGNKGKVKGEGSAKGQGERKEEKDGKEREGKIRKRKGK